MAATGTSGGSHALGASARLHAFFDEQIWSVRSRDLPRAKRPLYRAARVLYSTVSGFGRNRLTIRAAALTYYTVLSIVPFLAFAFAVVKGLGAYRLFVDGTVRPWVSGTFEGSPAMLRATDAILSFVDRTDVSTLGAVGLLTLVYTSVSLLGSIEDALNDIWGARQKRPLVRQVTNYVTLLVTTPLLVIAATSYATAAQSSHVVQLLHRVPGLGPALAFLPRVLSSLIVAAALMAVYTILPNIRTRPRSALLGAAVGAVLWQVALTLHVRFQVGVAGYNALYSALGAVPIFLVWTYFSWIIVLLGAQVAASHQNEELARQRFNAERIDQALKETLAVVATAQIARDFVSGAPPRGVGAIAQELEVPAPVVEDVCAPLVRAGILVDSTTSDGHVYVLAHDADRITLRDVQDAVRRDSRSDGTRRDVERRVPSELRRLLDAAEHATRTSPANVTLRQLGAALAG